MSVAKSEIRQSEITALLEKVRKYSYGQYLWQVTIGRMRGLKDATVRFDFPVTALIGPNGGGKSTILGAAACAYKETKPGSFFPKSSIGDRSMADWNMEYEIIDRNKQTNGNPILRRTAKFRSQRWIRDNLLSRELSYFGINRTVALTERPEFTALKNSSYQHDSKDEIPFPDEISKQIEYILGKSIKGFRKTDIAERKNTIYIGNNSGQDYSEFHFGAGESSIIRIVSEIENMPENSLILIEELENGLHPIAARHLVEYLITAALRKKNQVIFTTHSDETLLPLPNEAIWACFDGRVQQGKLSVKSLRMLAGKIEKQLAIFVEDDFAKIIVKAVLQEFFDSDIDIIDQTEIHVLSGDGTAVKVHKNRQNDPTKQYESLCVLDGDSQQEEDIDKGIIKLPGDQPEWTVFQDTNNQLDNRIGYLTVYLHIETIRQPRVADVIRNVSHTCRDPHFYFAQISEKLGFIPLEVVQDTFVKLWIRENKKMFEPIVSQIKKRLAATMAVDND